ncbi:MAG: glycogen debranching enzyme GlgX, partial [Proteobacteria bacterium]|nr:glycogen debranching enzyme GlgX [Pseudomonadota bacterium]
DSVRNFWLRRHASMGELAGRLCASRDLFDHLDRRPQASINFIAAHDGFSLHDLTSYEHKHNEANGEDNRDGHNQNLSWNCGCEGESAAAEVLQLRRRLQRALLATLLFSQGVPMLLGGDELGRSQRGNNNAYCQDNPINWFDWVHADGQLVEFVARLTRLRREFPQLRRTEWLSGRKHPGRHADIIWLHPTGVEMSVAYWHDPARHAFAFLLGPETGCESLLLCLINAETGTVPFKLPPGSWHMLVNSADDAPGSPSVAAHGGSIELAAPSLALLSQPLAASQAERNGHALPA